MTVIALNILLTLPCYYFEVFTEWGIFSRSALNFHGVQYFRIFIVKPNIKTAFADETKTSTNAEKPLFTRL